MANLLLTIAYDGRRYHGWQIQSNAVAVQAVFQTALFAVLGHETDIKACSRTDTGVHARQFCISFHTHSGIPPARIPLALNRFLPDDIAALSCRQVPEGFHARYDCAGKEYVYEVWNHRLRNPFLDGRALHYWRRLDEKRLSQAAGHYVGTHDFSSFCTLDRREKGDLVRTVQAAAVTRAGDRVFFRVSADGFLYNMVRIMMGTLLRVQEGKIQPEEIPQIIASRNRAQAGPTAPACGLYLNHVYYEGLDEEAKVQEWAADGDLLDG